MASVTVVISEVTLDEYIDDVCSTVRMVCSIGVVDMVAERVRVETSVLNNVLLVITLSIVVVSKMLAFIDVVVHKRMLVDVSVSIEVNVNSKKNVLVVETVDVIVANSIAVRLDSSID